MINITRQYKIIVLGDSNVGKTSLINKYCNDPCYDITTNTIGVDLKVKYKYINNECHKMQIWDTSGQERFHSIISSFYNNVDGVLLVYDVNDKKEKSIASLKYWHDEVLRKNEKKHVQIMIIGNKEDKHFLRENIITSSDVKFITQIVNDDIYNVPVVVTNTINGVNIDYIFATMLGILMLNKSIEDNYVSINLSSNDKYCSSYAQKNKCCY
jgi:small GTP-binding protein